MILETKTDQAQVLPLNECDVDQLNTYFEQNGISTHADSSTVKIFRLNQFELPHDLEGQAVFNLMVSNTRESFDELRTAVDEIMSINAYSGLCNDLKNEAGGSRLSMHEYCKANAHHSTVKDILAEFDSITNDKAYGATFKNFNEKYAEFKNDLEGINDHTLAAIENSDPSKQSELIQCYSKVSNEFTTAFNESFDKLYLQVNENKYSIAIQDDFNQFVNTNLNKLNSIDSRPEKDLSKSHDYTT